jgi:hypothetical protein
MEVFYRVWVPSLVIGRRMIEQECGLLETWKLRGSWYNITPDTAERAIHVAARNCRVPLLDDAEYRQLSGRDKAERLLERAGAMATGLRTT